MVVNEIKFKYVFDDDYRPTYVNGAFGGINAGGEIIMNFFTERFPIPHSETFEISPEGRPLNLNRKDPEENIMIRTIEGGIILTPDHAQEIYNWLGDQLKICKEMKKNV